MIIRNAKGFTLIELMIVVAIIGILALIAIPNFVTLRARAYQASAVAAGRSAKTAMEVYYNEKGGDVDGSYTGQLSDLLAFDRNLTDDPGVTFVFVATTNSGYTYYTQHAQGLDRTFQFHD